MQPYTWLSCYEEPTRDVGFPCDLPLPMRAEGFFAEIQTWAQDAEAALTGDQQEAVRLVRPEAWLMQGNQQRAVDLFLGQHGLSPRAVTQRFKEDVFNFHAYEITM